MISNVKYTRASSARCSESELSFEVAKMDASVLNCICRVAKEGVIGVGFAEKDIVVFKNTTTYKNDFVKELVSTHVPVLGIDASAMEKSVRLVLKVSNKENRYYNVSTRDAELYRGEEKLDIGLYERAMGHCYLLTMKPAFEAANGELLFEELYLEATSSFGVGRDIYQPLGMCYQTNGNFVRMRSRGAYREDAVLESALSAIVTQSKALLERVKNEMSGDSHKLILTGEKHTVPMLVAYYALRHPRVLYSGANVMSFKVRESVFSIAFVAGTKDKDAVIEEIDASIEREMRGFARQVADVVGKKIDASLG